MIKPLLLFFALYSFAFIPGFFLTTRLRQSTLKIFLLAALFIYVSLLPFVIPPEYKLLRFLIIPILFPFGIKNIDLSFRKAAHPEELIGFREYLKSNFFIFEKIEAASQETQKPDYRGSIRYFFSGIFQICSGIMIILLNTYFRTPEWSWPIATILKLGCFYWFASGLTDLSFSYFRLLGKAVTPVYNEPIRAVSPEDLWSNRLNIYMRQYLVRFVFLPVGGAKHPNWGILATFIASGLIHEYQFDAAASRVTGFVLGYFIIQGLGVTLERKLKRYLRKKHNNFYEKAGRSRLIPIIFVPLHTAWAILTGTILLKALDQIIDIFNIEVIKQVLLSLPLPPCPG